MTALGYRRFWCSSCRRRFNERTSTPFNELQFPTDIVLLAVLWRLRYKLGLRDVAELLLQRGYEVTHETIRDWEFRFAPLINGAVTRPRVSRQNPLIELRTSDPVIRLQADVRFAASARDYYDGRLLGDERD